MSQCVFFFVCWTFRVGVCATRSERNGNPLMEIAAKLPPSTPPPLANFCHARFPAICFEFLCCKKKKHWGKFELHVDKYQWKGLETTVDITHRRGPDYRSC